MNDSIESVILLAMPQTPLFRPSVSINGPLTPPIFSKPPQEEEPPRSKRLSFSIGSLKKLNLDNIKRPMAPSIPTSIKGMTSNCITRCSRIARRKSIDREKPQETVTPPPSFSKALGEPDFEATRIRRHTDSSAMLKVAAANDFGEAIVIEILSATDLPSRDCDPYVEIQFQGIKRTSSVVKGTSQPVYNERFVFWSREASIDETIKISVHNRNVLVADEHLGSTVLDVQGPIDESVDKWYDLNGKGQIRIAFRRMPIENVSVLFALQTISSHDHPINEKDLKLYGNIVPVLWYGFTETRAPTAGRHRIGETLTDRVSGFGRRLLGRKDSTTPRRKHTIL